MHLRNFGHGAQTLPREASREHGLIPKVAQHATHATRIGHWIPTLAHNTRRPAKTRRLSPHPLSHPTAQPSAQRPVGQNASVVAGCCREGGGKLTARGRTTTTSQWHCTANSAQLKGHWPAEPPTGRSRGGCCAKGHGRLRKGPGVTRRGKRKTPTVCEPAHPPISAQEPKHGPKAS